MQSLEHDALVQALERLRRVEKYRNGTSVLPSCEAAIVLCESALSHAGQTLSSQVSDQSACENCAGQKHTDMGTTVCPQCRGTGLEVRPRPLGPILAKGDDGARGQIADAIRPILYRYPGCGEAVIDECVEAIAILTAGEPIYG